MNCQFCEKRESSWRCPDCGAWLCDKCAEKKANAASLVKMPFTIVTFGAVNTLKRVCTRCGSTRLKSI